jgi:hypothetical protein
VKDPWVIADDGDVDFNDAKESDTVIAEKLGAEKLVQYDRLFSTLVETCGRIIPRD